MKRYITIACVLIAAFMFASCQDALNESQAGQDAKLVVSIGGAERTLAPKDTELNNLEYWLIVRSYDYASATYVGIVEPGVPVTFLIPAGSYQILAEAYDITTGGGTLGGGYLVANQEKEVSLRTGELHNEKLTLIPAFTSDVEGYFQYSISYEALDGGKADDSYEGIDSIRLTLAQKRPNNGYFREIWDLLDNNEGKLTVPPGIYDMTVELKSKRYAAESQNVVSFKEVVYIYPGKTTVTPLDKYVYRDTDFTAKIQLFGTAAITGNIDYTLSKVIVYYDDSDLKVSDGYVFDGTTYYPNPATIKCGESGDVSNTAYQVVLGSTNTISGASDSWDLFFNSHLMKKSVFGSYNQAKIRLMAKSTTANAELYSQLYTRSLKDLKYSSSTEFYVGAETDKKPLSIKAVTLKLANTTLPGSGGNIDFNQTVAENGWTKFTLRTPAYYGLIGPSLNISGANPTFISSKDGNRNYTVGMNVGAANSDNEVFLTADFFHLRGSITMDSAGFPGTGTFRPVKIEAWEGLEEDTTPVAPDPSIPLGKKIGERTPVLRPTTEIYDFDFTDLTDYIWQTPAEVGAFGLGYYVFLRVYFEDTTTPIANTAIRDFKSYNSTMLDTDAKLITEAITVLP